MNARMPLLLGASGMVMVATVMVATALPAAAKNIPMPALSRGAVDQACKRAGGAGYGTHDDGPYGCLSHAGKVDCSADGHCEGYVSDLRPSPANSLEAILGGGVHAGPTKIGPSDRRVAGQP